jgi:hypothetical protein
MQRAPETVDVVGIGRPVPESAADQDRREHGRQGRERRKHGYKDRGIDLPQHFRSHPIPPGGFFKDRQDRWESL